MRRLRLLTLLSLTLSLPSFAQEGVYSLHLSNPQVTAITQDADGYIWFGTTRGLNRYNGTNYTCFYASGNDGSLNSDHILSLCYDSAGTLWIGTECGLNWYRDGKFHHMNSTVFDPVMDITEVNDTLVAFTGKSGRFVMTKDSLRVAGYSAPGENVYTSFTERVPVSFTDRDGGVWEADGENGWTYTAKNQPFRSLTVSPNGERLSHLFFDREGYLWMRIGTDLCSFAPGTLEPVWKDSEHVYSTILINRSGHLLALRDGATIVELTTHNGVPSLLNSARHSHTIYSMQSDENGYLWLSEISNLAKIGPNGSSIEHFQVGPTTPFSYILPCEGSRRIFIIGIRDGLLEVLPDGTVTPFGEGFQNVSCMLQARDGTFWMGTYNDGIIHYNEISGETQRFDPASGIADPSIKSITQDGEGIIWYSSATHISRYDPWTRTFSALHDNSFRDDRFYNLLAATSGQDGKLYFAGSGGLTIVDPFAFNPSTEDTPLQMELITVNDQEYPRDAGRLNLSHRENTLNFRFAGIDYASGQLLDYSWKLDGFEENWHSASTRPEAIYTLLPPGRYTFHARVRVLNGEWSKSEIVLPVTIRPAPWASTWAKLLYLLLAIAVIGTGLLIVIRMRTQKERLELAGQRAELNQQHIDFMTNISHEFRTPLTMILAPAKELEKSDLPPREKELASLISRNAEQLKALSEQLLSSRGGRGSQEQLNIRENDLVSILRSMTKMFGYAASQKEQELTTDLPDSLLAAFDTEKVSKVMGNLISNAIKYTPEGGHICIALRQEGQNAVIDVKDDGIGIPEEKRSRIFDRFDRLGAEDSGVIGSGIGLNFAQSMATLHKGALTYAPNGSQGSVFTFTFPIDKSAYPEADLGPAEPDTKAPYALEGDSQKAQTLLIAEDTTEIRLFLRDLFHADYNVILASDGLEAVDNLKLSVPDLVLSDVIMPGKTGYGLCADIKSNPDWNHIPVVLLTAKADAESSVEGMKAGADAYVAKPFDPDFLKATVESLLKNRRILQEKVKNLTSADLQDPQKSEEVKLSPSERKLLEKIHAYLDANLENEESDVASMARELGMSYSNLYAKVKALTGETPKAYATAYRMNIARNLLVSGEWTVSEVADKVGSSSPFTFSREFKNYFGYPPSQAKKV
ncbi:MAG: response regulator [Bacteroidales bacterium]|nr:response regulator [Bacteroidales bacterium]